MRQWPGGIKKGSDRGQRRVLSVCMLLPWLQVSWDPLSLGEKKAKSTCPREERAWACSWIRRLASIYVLGFRREQAFFQTTQSLSWLSLGFFLCLPPSNSFPRILSSPMVTILASIVHALSKRNSTSPFSRPY